MLAAVLVLLVLALAPAAIAAAPEVHAHRGGTVQNGTPRFAEESIRACWRDGSACCPGCPTSALEAAGRE